MKQIPLVELVLYHDYYADGRCPDFAIEPTPATQALLQNHRCVLKASPTGVQILITISVQGMPFIPLSPNSTFTFHLRLRNPEFSLFTDLTAILSLDAPLYTNDTSSETDVTEPEQLLLDSRRTRATDRFVVQQPGVGERFALHNRPRRELDLADFTVSGLGDISQPAGYDEDARLIEVDTHLAQEGALFTVDYPATPQLERGVWADVDIHIGEVLPNLNEGPMRFQIEFPTKQARWTYYVVSENSSTEFRIEDNGESPVQFSDANRTHLNQQIEPADRIATLLAERYPEQQRWRFVSDTPVPCQQRARKTLQLHKNGDTVPGSLPNPSLRNYAVAPIDSSSDQTENSLFQIIKLL